jgi:arginyl-tRNA synthetase
MLAIREHIVERLKAETSFPPERLLGLFKQADNAHGDLALPCFPFAKELKRKPDEIARDFATRFDGDPLFAQVEAVGPFLNFTFDGPELARMILPGTLDAPERIGRGTEGAGKTLVIDYSSPNIAKPIAFHHVRSTAIGFALANLHAARGWKVERINYLGDWGTQFGKLIVAYKLWGDREALERDQIRHLLEIYVRFHTEAETKPELEDEAREWFAKMERGDEAALELWRLFYDISMKEFSHIYGELGIFFDRFEGESRYRDDLDAVIERIGATVGTEQSKGATIVNLDDLKLPPCLLRKADGATLYATRDIAAAIDRYERFHFDRSLYVVAQQQALHFQQFFAVLKRMGFEWAERMEHISFGMLQMAEGTMSTRKGQVIFLQDVIDKAVALSREAIEEKNAELPDKEAVAHMVGVGAILFGDLVNKRTNDITFEWSRILNFQGETGVYVQYTHARCRSMLRKGGGLERAAVDVATLALPEEKDVLKLIGLYDELVAKAAETCDPSLVARHLIDLCKTFNKLYTIEGYRFLDDDATRRNSRLALALACANVLKSGLGLLGVQAPEEM